MGKHNKHKKKLRAEKAKTQLKAAKTTFLPKGGNSTDVNFKIKPIVIREQLKELAANEPLNKKKLDLEQLIKRLKHYNPTVKVETCESIIKILNEVSLITLRWNLYILFPIIGDLFEDRDRRVRKHAVLLLDKLYLRIPESSGRAYIDKIAIRLACAMTNIDKNIKEDSILVVDVLLKHPALISDIFSMLFPNFLNLISRINNGNDLKRTLTVNLESKLTVTQWRIEVLSRIEKLLSGFLKQKELETEACKIKYKVFHIEEMLQGRHLPVLVPDRSKECELVRFSRGAEHINKVQPLLYEMLLEVVPINRRTKDVYESGTSLTKETASILNSVVAICHHLLNLIGAKDFQTKYDKKLYNHLVSNFPYYQLNSAGEEQSSSCLKVNLIICGMYAALNKELPSEFLKLKAKHVLAFLKDCVDIKRFAVWKNIDLLIAALRIVLVDNWQVWWRNNIDVESLLDSLIIYYKSLTIKDPIKIMNLLKDIIKTKAASRQLIRWLRELPTSLLLKPTMSYAEIHLINIAACSARRDFLDSIENNLLQILNNLLTMKFEPSVNFTVDKYYRPFIGIIYILDYIRFNHTNINIIQSFMENHKNHENTDMLKCLPDILHYNAPHLYYSTFQNVDNGDNC